MNRFCLAIAVLPCLSLAAAWADDYSKRPTETLVDELTAIDTAVPGIDGNGTFRAFLAVDDTPQFLGGRLPVAAPAVPAPMRELVRRGPSALPALLAHLADKRSTKIVVGREIGALETFGGQFFSDEYDARDLRARPSGCANDDTCPRFEHAYAVKVADVCEVLIGQIVNRRLSAVRYQPTAILLVNSPVETPSLAERIRGDWRDLDARAHEASLLSDLHAEDELDDWHGYRDALVRLRFYYPKTYAALSGKDLEKRVSFETDEIKSKAQARRSQHK